jgi:hypothetical protein
LSIFEDMLLVQKNTMKRSIKSFKTSWPIIFTGIVYTLINIVVLYIISLFFTGILSIVAGLISAIISSSLISNYLYLLYNAINFNRITLDIFKEGFTQYLWKVYGVFFIGWVASYALSIVTNMAGTSGAIIYSIVSLLALILLNSLPETIYQKYYSSAESIRYSFDFIKENWLNWFIPNIILFAIIYIVTGRLILNIFTTHLVMGFDLDIMSILRYIIGQSLFSFAMIYRGHLFDLLSTSTRRKRMFMNRLYED